MHPPPLSVLSEGCRFRSLGGIWTHNRWITHLMLYQFTNSATGVTVFPSIFWDAILSYTWELCPGGFKCYLGHMFFATFFFAWHFKIWIFMQKESLATSPMPSLAFLTVGFPFCEHSMSPAFQVIISCVSKWQKWEIISTSGSAARPDIIFTLANCIIIFYHLLLCGSITRKQLVGAGLDRLCTIHFVLFVM